MKRKMNATGWVLAVLFAILWLAVPQDLEAKADASDVVVPMMINGGNADGRCGIDGWKQRQVTLAVETDCF